MTSQETLPKAYVRHARRAMEDGQYRKAIQALSSVGLAPPSPEVLDGMLSKHEQAPPPPTPATNATPTSANISEADVLSAMKSFPAGSSPGPSSLRGSHLKEVLLCPSPDFAAHATRAGPSLIW